MSGQVGTVRLAERVLLRATRIAMIALGLTALTFGLLVAAGFESGSPAAVALGVVLFATIVTAAVAVLAVLVAAASLGRDANRVFLRALFIQE